jgi:hypothetical protein
MAKTPKDQKPANFPEWMQELVAAGKQFDQAARRFGDYFPTHPTVKALLAEKDRQISELNRKLQQQQLQSTRGGEKPGGRGGEKPGGRGGEKPHTGNDRGGERQSGNWNGNQHSQNRSATGFKPHNPDIICMTCKQKGHPSHKCPNKAESSVAAARWADAEDEESPEIQARLLEAFNAGMKARK